MRLCGFVITAHREAVGGSVVCALTAKWSLIQLLEIVAPGVRGVGFLQVIWSQLLQNGSKMAVIPTFFVTRTLYVLCNTKFRIM